MDVQIEIREGSDLVVVHDEGGHGENEIEQLGTEIGRLLDKIAGTEGGWVATVPQGAIYEGSARDLRDALAADGFDEVNGDYIR